MKKYIHIWKNGNPMIGSSAIIPIDNRWGYKRIILLATQRVMDRHGDGFSIGPIVSHDPDNTKIGRYIPV
jgi:hypothetical protein